MTCPDTDRLRREALEADQLVKDEPTAENKALWMSAWDQYYQATDALELAGLESKYPVDEADLDPSWFADVPADFDIELLD